MAIPLDILKALTRVVSESKELELDKVFLIRLSRRFAGNGEISLDALYEIVKKYLEKMAYQKLPIRQQIILTLAAINTVSYVFNGEGVKGPDKIDLDYRAIYVVLEIPEYTAYDFFRTLGNSMNRFN